MAAEVVAQKLVAEVVGDTSKAEQSLKQFEAKFKGFAKRLTTTGSKAFTTLSKAMTTPFERAGRIFEKLKNIIMYRLIRQGISRLIQGLQEGLKNITAYDEALNRSSFSKAATIMEDLNVRSTLLKNTFGSLGMTVIAVVKPAIDAITTTLINAANAANMFISALMGRNGYTKAIAGISDANKAAGQLQRTLLGFDEINRLNGDNGGSSDSMEKFFEESALTGFAETLKNQIAQGDYAGVGQALGEKLNDIVNSFDMYGLGARIGTKIRHAVDIGLEFLRTFDFSNAGKKVADLFNGIFEFVNWSDVGATLVRRFTSVIDFLGGMLGNLDWGAIAKGLSNFLAGAMNEATAWLRDKDWSKATQTLFECIKGFVSNIDFGAIFKAMWELASTLVTTGLGVLITGFGNIFITIGTFLDNQGYTLPGSIFKGIGEGLNYWGSLIFGKGKDTADEYGDGLEEGLAGVFKTVGDWIDKINSLLTGEKLEIPQWMSEPLLPKIKDALSNSTVYTNVYGRDHGVVPEKQKYDWNTPLIKQIKFKATGGTVPTGDLFIANEQGPELVGSVGGRTTVTNQDQFVAGMEAANEPVVQAILSAANAIIGTVNSKNYTVELDGAKVSKQIYSAMNSEGMRRGTSLAWGQ